jgi:steroid 5-alpha reductase family enzyme
MMSATFTFAVGCLLVAIALGIVWLFQLKSENANMVDPVWAWTLGGLGVLCAVCGTAPVSLRVMSGALSALWALRLGTHLFIRNFNAPEDKRYARFRKQWGADAQRNLFLFIEFQTVFSALLALPFVVIAWRDDLPPLWAVVAAFVVWSASILGEAVADAELARFRRDPGNRGRVNRQGLWRYSRHPNYFFECLHWSTYLLLSVGTAWWWVGLIPPAVMAYLLLKLSGIPMVESQMAKERPEYAEYIRSTSAFIPWPPKKTV